MIRDLVCVVLFEKPGTTEHNVEQTIPPPLQKWCCTHDVWKGTHNTQPWGGGLFWLGGEAVVSHRSFFMPVLHEEA